MRAIVLARTYDTYGGHNLPVIAHLLEEAARRSGCDAAEFIVTACFRAVRPPRPGLESLHAEFQASLTALPSARWEPKKRRFQLEYESRVDMPLGLASPPPSRDLLISAVNELAAVLESLAPRLSHRRGLDARALAAMVASLPDLVPPTDDEIAAFARVHDERRREEQSRLPWWEQLEIDWDEYHPSARTRLDEPFFWREEDEWSPHGSDTGADLLAEFRRWRRSHRTAPAVEFLQTVLDAWDVPTHWRQRPVDEWRPATEDAVVAHDQAVIALAFALIKLEGSCESTVRAMAIESLDRQADPRVAAHFGWNESAGRLQALSRMRAVLSADTPA